MTDPRPADDNVEVQTDRAHNDQDHTVYTRPIPPTWLLGFAIFMIAVTVISLWWTKGNGPLTIVNILLALLAGGGLWLLWLTPSRPGRLELGEVFLGLFILFVGAMIGSSPTFQPLFSKCWTALHLDPRLANAIAAPNDTSWQYNGTFIVPGTLPSPHQRLVVATLAAPEGVVLDQNGIDVKGLKTVQMWLQDNSTGQSSSSIIVYIKPEVSSPAPPVTPKVDPTTVDPGSTPKVDPVPVDPASPPDPAV